MSLYNRPAIQGQRPWGQNYSVLEEPKEAAPRQEAVYRCPRGHERTVPFAAGVTPPPAWDCRQCGRTAYLDGAPQDAAVDLPGYTRYGEKHPDHRAEITPMAQLRKRRSKREGAALLAERLAWVRESGVAR